MEKNVWRQEMKQTGKEEQIAFHRGALNSLAGEQQELVKMLQSVQNIAQAHIKALKDLGVDVEGEAKAAIEKIKKEQTKKLDERMS